MKKKPSASAAALSAALIAIVLTACVFFGATLVRFYYFRLFAVTGDSMNPTYAAGDAIYADTTEEPDFYDVIVFYLPVSETRADNPALSKYTSNAFWRSMPFFGGKIPLGTDMNGWEILVKRVAGLPFDTVELRAETVDGENRVFLYRNGEKIDEDFNMYDETAITAEKSDAENPYFSLVSPMAAVKLGADEYFVLGDNRDDSRDGRSFGAVKKEYIFGTVRR